MTGITGQDGFFLVELLTQKGYDIIGLVRGGSVERRDDVAHLGPEIELLDGDLLDGDSLIAAVARVRPQELYHLASPSFVPPSWIRPAKTLAAIAGATAVLLEAVRDHSPHSRVFVAGSSTMFGAAPECPQREDTACRPVSPYGTAKLAAHQLVGQMRGRDGLFACSGILYNHESERRSESFVSRKVARAAAAIKLGLADELALGDLEAIRDWSFAGDVMLGAWLTLQQKEPADYILASGVPHTVRELAEIAFGQVGLNAADHIRVDPALTRAPESTPQVGDATLARQRLGWRPTVTFEELIGRMVYAELCALEAR